MLNDNPLKPRTLFSCADAGDQAVNMLADVMSVGGDAAALAWRTIGDKWLARDATSDGLARHVAYEMTLHPELGDSPAVRSLVRKFQSERERLFSTAA